MRTKTEIVILNWNGAGHLRRFLPSVLASVPEGVGVVVADNGSTDDSLGVLEREFPAVGRIVLDRNYGFAGGYNRALEYLDADYFILLNSDVETPAGWVEPLVETLDRDRTVAAVAPKLLSLVEPARFEYAGASGGFIDYLGYPFCRGRILQCVERDEGQYDDARDVFWASGAAFCCRAEVFRAMGGFDEDFFAHMEEIDLCWRILNTGGRIRYLASSIVYHVGGATLQKYDARKTFLNFRNSLFTLVKNLPAYRIPYVVLCRLLLDGVQGVRFLTEKRPRHTWALVRAHFSFYGGFLRMWRKRQTPFKTRRYYHTASIVFSHFVLGTKYFSEL